MADAKPADAPAASTAPAPEGALPKRERKERKDKAPKAETPSEKAIATSPSAGTGDAAAAPVKAADAPAAEKKEKKPKAEKKADGAAGAASKSDDKADKPAKDKPKAEEKEKDKPKGDAAKPAKKEKAEKKDSSKPATDSLVAAFAAAAAAALGSSSSSSAAAPAAAGAGKKEGGGKKGAVAAAEGDRPAAGAGADKGSKKDNKKAQAAATATEAAPASAAAPAAAPAAAEGKQKRERGQAAPAAAAAAAPAAAPAAAGAGRRDGGSNKPRVAPPAAPPAAAHAPVVIKPPTVTGSQDIRKGGAGPINATTSGGAAARAGAGAGGAGYRGGASSAAIPAAVTKSLVPSSVVAAGGAPVPPPSAPSYFYGGYGSRMPRKGVDGLYCEQLEIPTPLLESGWVSSDEGKAFIDQVRAKTGVTEILVVKPRSRLGHYEVKGTAQPLVRAATELLDMHCKHQVQLQSIAARAAAFDEDLAQARREMEAGLRVEFSVPAEVIGMVIGKGGATINRVKESTGVERIVVDADAEPPTVRIRGSDAEGVADARRQLEYDVRTISLSKGQIGWIAPSLNDIRDRSKVVRIDLEDPADEGAGPAAKPLLRVTGLKLAVNTACMLIETQLQFQDEFKKAQAQEKEVREKLRQLDISFGDAPNAGYGGGGAAGRGAGRRDNRDRGDRGDRGAAPSGVGKPYVAPAGPAAAASGGAGRRDNRGDRSGAAAPATAAPKAAERDLDPRGGAGARRRRGDEDEAAAAHAPAPARATGGGRGGGAAGGAGRR